MSGPHVLAPLTSPIHNPSPRPVELTPTHPSIQPGNHTGGTKIMHRNIQPSPSPQLLTTIARHMEALARAAPWKPGMPLKPYRRTLTGGMTLTYFFDARLSKWNLWLSATRTHPTIVEPNPLPRAFSCPPGHQ